MAATPYKPTSWSDEDVTKEKLSAMSNNDQWLFENMAKARYTYNGLVRDAGLKVLAGKIYKPGNPGNFQYVAVYFGSFFSVGCRPVITTGLEQGNHRSKVVVQGYGGEMDHTGFTAVVTTSLLNDNLNAPGWIHYQAIGY